MPLLGQGTQREHEYLYWELPRYIGKTGEFRDELPAQGLRMGKWKAVRPEPDGKLELYNLETDPSETTNVSAQNPDVMAQVEQHLKAARVPPRKQSEPPHIWWDSKG